MAIIGLAAIIFGMYKVMTWCEGGYKGDTYIEVEEDEEVVVMRKRPRKNR
jgi:hypothetical protein